MRRQGWQIAGLILAAVVFLPLSLGAVVAPQYFYQDLGDLGGGKSGAKGINARGQVVGWSYVNAVKYHAFLWTRSRGMEDLGSLSGDAMANAITDSGHVMGQYGSKSFFWNKAVGLKDLGNLGGTATWAFGINNKGQVVGYSNNADGFTRAFLRSAKEEMKDLGTLGGDNSIAGGINDRGQVVGYTEINADIGHAFIWSKAEGMKSLGTLGGNESNALDINNRGQVVGSSTILPGDNFSVAFLWTPQEGMRLLGHQGLDTCWGSHINNKGQVMGNSINFNPVKMKAFFWAAPGPLKDLGTLGGENTAAASLNNKGQVVGSSHDGVEERAILWTQDQGLVDLNTLLVNPPAGDVLKFANQINDRGWIVGTTKNERAFLLTPK